MPAQCLRWFLSSKAMLYLGSCKHKMLRQPSKWTLSGLRNWSLPASLWFNHKNSLSCITGNPIAKCHFTTTSTTKNALLLVWAQRYEHAAHAVDLFAFAGPADTTKCIHGAYAKTIKNFLQGFSTLCKFVAMSSKETITWNPSSFTPQFSVSLCMECRKLQMPTNCKPRLV